MSSRRGVCAAALGGLVASALPRGLVAAGARKRVAILWLGMDEPRPPEERKEYESRFEVQGFRPGRDVEILWFETVLRMKGSPTIAENVAAMVRAKPDLMIIGEFALAELRRLAPAIPAVVQIDQGDPVDLGVARSIARPGGNFTGLYAAPYETHAKRMQILKQFAPDLSCVGWIAFEPQLTWFPTFERAARSNGLRVEKIVVRVSDGPRFEPVRSQVRELRRRGCAAAHLHTGVDTLIDAVARSALESRILVSSSGADELIATEGLLFAHYAVMSVEGYTNQKRIVPIAARILRGERAGDIAFEGPVGSRLVVNRKTSRRIGVTIPAELLVLADEVID